MRALSEFIARSRTVPCVCIAGIVRACSRNPGSVAAPTAVRHEGRRAAQNGWRRGRQRCGTRRHRRPPVTRHQGRRGGHSVAAGDARTGRGSAPCTSTEASRGRRQTLLLNWDPLLAARVPSYQRTTEQRERAPPALRDAGEGDFFA